MLSRRRFAACAICAGGGLLAAQVGARAQGPGFTRTVLHRADSPGEAMATLQVLVEIDPGTLIARHTHPGSETSYILEGGGTFGARGEADRAMRPGDTFQVGHSVPHYLQNGPAKTRVLAVYVVEKDKPLASPAPE